MPRPHRLPAQPSRPSAPATAESLATPEQAWAWTRGERHVVALNMSAEELVLPGLPGAIQICTDRARELEAVGPDLRLAPFEGVILERT